MDFFFYFQAEDWYVSHIPGTGWKTILQKKAYL